MLHPAGSVRILQCDLGLYLPAVYIGGCMVAGRVVRDREIVGDGIASYGDGEIIDIRDAGDERIAVVVVQHVFERAGGYALIEVRVVMEYTVKYDILIIQLDVFHLIRDHGCGFGRARQQEKGR